MRRGPSASTVRYRAEADRRRVALSTPVVLPEWFAGSLAVVTDDLGKRWNTTIQSAPWNLGGYPVVLIEGIAGGYLCSRIVVGEHDPELRHFSERSADLARGGL